MTVDNPKDANALYADGTTRYFARRYHDAITTLTEALELEPRHYRAYDRRGSAYKALKQYDFALADYNRALEINPTFENSLRNRGHLFRSLHLYQSAIDDYEASKRYCIDARDIERLEAFIQMTREKLEKDS